MDQPQPTERVCLALSVSTTEVSAKVSAENTKIEGRNSGGIRLNSAANAAKMAVNQGLSECDSDS